MHATNNPELRSWIESANNPECDFPIQNLPFGIFSRKAGPASLRRVGIAIGDQVLDLAEAWPELEPEYEVLGVELFDQSSLNEFLDMGKSIWMLVREKISQWLRHDNAVLRDNLDLRHRALLPMTEVDMHLPVVIGDYSDFYASEYHATNVGSMFRPDNPLLPNWKHIPVGYHGRASSVVVSGTNIRRPHGQILSPGQQEIPEYKPSNLLDYELEIGFITGTCNDLGSPIPIDKAHDHIFGLVLINDWSARDIQKWEYQPLGPFLAKNFATSISPWVVPLIALEPYRVTTERKAEDPAVQRNLDGAWDWGIDILLQVHLQSNKMKLDNIQPHLLTNTNFKYMYWNICHQLTHQASSGCNIRSGDLYGSGTISGPTKESRGCLLELCWRGTEPVTLPNGEQRKFLADYDNVIISGYCGGSGGSGEGLGITNEACATKRPRIGFGTCTGTILPALVNPDM